MAVRAGLAALRAESVSDQQIVMIYRLTPT
jgi:hypothetical protein